MRFLYALWSLILGSLTLFSLALYSHELFAQDLPIPAAKLLLLVSAWAVGIASAGAIHMLYLRAEEAVQSAARDQTIVQLAGAVAHELNQPLTVLISSGELLSHPRHTPEETRELAMRMVDASVRISGIVDKLQSATHYRTKEYAAGIKIVDLDRAG